ncbi:tryptophan-rich sensory protein [Halosimplex litoreum]|uniref:Tryptophan-rich sensory protein n=1 Tax=Halosimplex litoreum TaxID=1198301 RepID=A0A7U3WAK2_9EURY|nr:TspO/MBR family protein [Halosimplex litoreum]QPV64647.1 tryptophan-rich sensory protein [Halosimplex litoreum]
MVETRTIGSGGWGRERVLTIVAGVLLVNLVGAAPAVLSGPGSPWFQALAKPAIYPPPWVFGVVWTALFTLLGVAVALVWLTDGRGTGGPNTDGNGWTARRVALAAFVGQMVLNVAWTPAFFAAENLLAGLVVIVALWPAVVATIWAFDRVDRRAAALLVPYLAWVTFAALLNYRFLALN